MNGATRARSGSLAAGIPALGIAAVGLVLAAFLRSPVPLLLPVAVLAIAVFGARVLSDPVPALAAFLLVIVNLDFLKLGAAGALTLDIVVSTGLLWILLVRCGLERRSLIATSVARAYLVLLIVTLISVVLSVSPLVSIKRWVRDLEYLVLFSLLVGLPLMRAQRRTLVGALIASSILPCLLGLAGLVFNVPALLGDQAPINEGTIVRRIAATLSHPVTLSLYLAIVAPATFALLLDGREFRRRVLAPLFALQILALYFTYARAGWLACGIALVGLLWLRGHRRSLLFLVPLVILALAHFLPAFRGRWQMVTEVGPANSALWRLGLWSHALQIFLQRPIFGSGPGTFLEHVAYQTGYGPHQTWVGMLVETGLAGTFAFLILLIVVGRALIVRRRDPAVRSDPLLNAALAVWVGLAITTLAAHPFGLPSATVYFWALAGLALSRSGHIDSHRTPDTGVGS